MPRSHQTAATAAAAEYCKGSLEDRLHANQGRTQEDVLKSGSSDDEFVHSFPLQLPPADKKRQHVVEAQFLTICFVSNVES